MHYTKLAILLALLTAPINASQLSVNGQEEDPNLQIRIPNVVFNQLKLELAKPPFVEGRYYVSSNIGGNHWICKYGGVDKATGKFRFKGEKTLKPTVCDVFSIPENPSTSAELEPFIIQSDEILSKLCKIEELPSMGQLIKLISPKDQLLMCFHRILEDSPMPESAPFVQRIIRGRSGDLQDLLTDMGELSNDLYAFLMTNRAYSAITDEELEIYIHLLKKYLIASNESMVSQGKDDQDSTGAERSLYEQN